ncbi:hypothetical protein Dsin_009170 [Dipteronia sinensis]|uniref:SWIM-type domain-containing protein n=1 Tax=Dipteronia sinensis TaxID=43782 RepID=A0AAE0ED84_9ROSI|nr:hypothetical protein Dsin_009170 [Dipteronia sinensis]
MHDNDDVRENEHVGADELGDQIDVVGLGADFGADLSKIGGVPGLRELAVIPEVLEFVGEMPDEIDNNDLFEGYQSNSEYEFFSDSNDEGGDSKLVTVMKSNPFKKLVGGPIRFEVGQTHDSVYTLRELLTDYAIQEGFNFKKIKNDKNRLTWACFAENCPWRLHASIIGDEITMQVKTYNNDHNCHRIYKSKEARSKWIASKFEVLVKNNPSIQCGVISDLLRDQFNVSVDPQRLDKAKKGALEVLLKDHTECFSYLRGYALMVQQCNPGSAAYIHLQIDTTIFQRPFIGIDGCHLKGPYGGVLLSAVALDTNSGLYHLAYCICEGETLLSWSWFLRQLHCFLKYPEDRPICFMSDRQKGVIGALKMYWPKASVRFCARHIYANFSTKYSGQKMRKLFWKASKTMAYLAAIEPCHWSRHAFDNSIKCDHVTNNMTKAFNSMLKDFRSRTYLGLMEYIRRMVMNRFQLRKEECNRWGNGIPPAVNKKIKDNSVECRILRTLHSGQGKYEMLGVNMAYTANLNDKKCECGQWQVSGVPCCHALAGIRHHFGVNGRPKLLRKRESIEKPKAARSGSVVCGKCILPGHNSRTCKTEDSPVETKKASKKQPTASEDECAASSSKPSKKRQRAAKHIDVCDKSSQPTTQVQTQPISQVTQLD